MNKDIERTKDEILANIGGYWKEVYNKAPTEIAKEYYRTNFAISSVVLATCDAGSIPAKLHEELYDIYHRLDDESWRYILSKTSGPSRLGLGRIWRGIREREGKPFPPPKE